MHLHFGDPSAGRKGTEERDATKRRFFSCGLRNGRVDRRSMASQHRRTSNTRLVKYSDPQVGLIYLSDAACGNCTAAAGLQAFFTGVKQRQAQGSGQGSCSVGEGRSVGKWEIEGA